MACPVLEEEHTEKIQHIRRSIPVEVLRAEAGRRALRACQEASSQARAIGEDIADAFRALEKQIAERLGKGDPA